MPNNPRGGGVSRRVEGDDRAELRELMDQIEVPQGMSLIARTAGIGRTLEELQWDLNYLLQLWHAIENAAASEPPPCLIYLESSLVVRAIRDLFQPDIGEILIDTEDIYEQARSFMSTVMPANVSKVKLYRDDVPLFSRFQIEHQIETAYRRDVTLPSGGAIVIDHTEALVSIDVNSARATRGADIEATALNTNVEAADEIARQLRLRDLGGLVVIDFIDMESAKNQREVENRLRDALRHDRARVQMGKISRFGLLELSRQRLQPSLGETSHIPCPRCSGTGHIRDTESSALHILRILQEEAMKENTAAIHAQVPVDVATYLLNEKRSEIHMIEARFRVEVVLIPNIHLETPNYTVERIRHDAAALEEAMPSYKLAATPAAEIKPWLPQAKEALPERPQPVVKGITPDQPAPVVLEPAPAGTPAPVMGQKVSLFARIARWFKAEATPAVVATPQPAAKPARLEGQLEGARRGGERAGERRGERQRRERQERPERQQQQRPPRPEKQERPAGRTTAPAIGEARPQAAPPEAAPQQRRQPKPEPAQLAEPAAWEAGEGGRGRRGRRGGRRERSERPDRSSERTLRTEQEAEAVAPAAAAASELPTADLHARPTPAPIPVQAPAFEAAPEPAPGEALLADLGQVPAVVPEPAPMPIGESTAVAQAVQQALFAVSVPEVTVPAESTPTPELSSPEETIATSLAATLPVPGAIPAAPVREIKLDLEAAGLVLVETKHDKATSFADQVEELEPRRPRRTRQRPQPPLASEPLVQVETHK